LTQPSNPPKVRRVEPTRILGLDIGTKRTGIALSDESRLFASPLIVITPANKLIWVETIKKICVENEVSEILVGVPFDQHGEAGDDALNIRKYIALLRERIKLPVVEWDERFTTVQATRMLIEGEVRRSKRKEVIDKVAAAIILQGYLDRLRHVPMSSEDSDNP